MYPAGLSADVAPDYAEGLIALTRKFKNVRTICRHDFQIELRQQRRNELLGADRQKESSSSRAFGHSSLPLIFPQAR